MNAWYTVSTFVCNSWITGASIKINNTQDNSFAHAASPLFIERFVPTQMVYIQLKVLVNIINMSTLMVVKTDQLCFLHYRVQIFSPHYLMTKLVMILALQWQLPMFLVL